MQNRQTSNARKRAPLMCALIVATSMIAGGPLAGPQAAAQVPPPLPPSGASGAAPTTAPWTAETVEAPTAPSTAAPRKKRARAATTVPRTTAPVNPDAADDKNEPDTTIAGSGKASAKDAAKDTGDVWYRLRMCESRNNYAINTGNGYYGAYQFAAPTWRALGYSGLPHEAPPAVQDEAARKLQAKAGWGQWPACARKLGLR
jgi:hypothetical protein